MRFGGKKREMSLRLIFGAFWGDGGGGFFFSFFFFAPGACLIGELFTSSSKLSYLYLLLVCHNKGS